MKARFELDLLHIRQAMPSTLPLKSFSVQYLAGVLMGVHYVDIPEEMVERAKEEKLIGKGGRFRTMNQFLSYTVQHFFDELEIRTYNPDRNVCRVDPMVLSFGTYRCRADPMVLSMDFPPENLDEKTKKALKKFFKKYDDKKGS